MVRYSRRQNNTSNRQKDKQQVDEWWKIKRQQIDYVRINRRLWMDGESVMVEKYFMAG